ncbi:hypothetical protein [Flavobacterium humi]|uniref:Lipoprotein n=1 Tax=Flavobacterium humi TaxID=2562683 RepID=A0A4Z0L7A6_9FLAO|nr:hypothetical protein [Flavobacterium humi]TGD57046.1 hypothetical protein E4635_12820 [Flavobacterium humi]
MKKFHTLVLLLLLAVFLLPGVSYACGAKIEKSCCKKEQKATPQKKDCCKKSKESGQGQKGCEGKCGQSNCTTSTMQYSVLSFNDIEIKGNFFGFVTEKKVFYHHEATLSSGFHSLWLLPKIA